MRVALALLVVFVASLFFYDQVLELVDGPYERARAALDRENITMPVITGAGGPLLLYLKLCGLAAVVSPAPTGSTRSGASSCPACTPTSDGGRGSSPRSPGRCS